MKIFRTHFKLVFLICLLTYISSCGNDETPISFNDSLTLEFSAISGGEPLEFNTRTYENAAGNEITIDRIKLYVSGLQLINSETGEAYIEQDGYHLVSLNDQSSSYSFTIEGLRDDFAFDKIKFAIGVDSERNFSIDNVGDLDPTNDMAWNWNTGYKFFLMEGDFLPGNNQERQGLVLHIGQDRNLVTQEFLLNGLNNIPSSTTLQFTLDAMAPLEGPNIIDLNTKSSFKVDVDSDLIAENYSQGLINLTTTEF